MAEETNVTYEQLADLEREFEDAEVEITRQQVAVTKPLYEKRQKTVAEIPNFWPLVFEQAPPEVDGYIQPSDAAVIATALKAVHVSRFELEDGSSNGDPRSLAIKLEFSENEYFEDSVLEKKFWYRRGQDGWTGLVSEPVAIKWKAGKDLTEGLLDQVMTVWKQQKEKAPAAAKSKKAPLKAKDFTPEQKALQKTIQKTGLGGVSFFAWFGFRGYDISAEESQAANEKEKEKRRLKAEGKTVEEDDEDEAPELVEEEDDEDEEDESALEIFPDGDELAIAISEDVWPSAIKYFTQAMEQDAMSDVDFEELEGEFGEDSEEEDEADEDAPPAKKRKA